MTVESLTSTQHSALSTRHSLGLGATYRGDGRCQFRVWAPRAERVAVHLVAPREQVVPLARGDRGYHTGVLEDVPPGSRYFYQLTNTLASSSTQHAARSTQHSSDRPDPASRHQPDGVHGPSAVVDPRAFTWSDAGWGGLPQQELVFYELHVGTFTPEGTFDAVIDHLDALRDLGITAIELMPVAQFPGSRNWGYDGVQPFAVQDSYGGPEGLRRLVDACHQRGLAVFLDVVYNHLGPEGNYLAEYGPYFIERYKTPWGAALNFDGPHSDEVRRYFIANALYWLDEFHVDGFRLDAIHAILDQAALPFLRELATAVQRRAGGLGRRVYVIAESDLNDPRVILPPALGGHGMDGQWADDLHHALHTLLTGEQRGYYQDYGRLQNLARAYREGYAYTGQYSAYRQRRYGLAPPRPCGAHQFVVCAQNHDQVGNRARGDRLSTLVPFPALKLAASVVLLSPFVPLLFMGEEYGETAPFQYFTSHSDPALVEAVRQGRRAEFAQFSWEGEVPDPQDEATFARSRLQHALRQEEPHRTLREYYRELLRLRRELPALADLNREQMEVVACEPERVLFVRRWTDDLVQPSAAGGDVRAEVWAAFSFGDAEASVTLPVPAGRWRKVLDAADARWLGPGSPVPAALESSGAIQIPLSPQSAVLFARVPEA